ncbi:MAG: hypothetical protein LBU44_04595, partial [Mediterranea sp.]|nr:hypothetical protein [Mediterranea sp.]
MDTKICFLKDENQNKLHLFFAFIKIVSAKPGILTFRLSFFTLSVLGKPFGGVLKTVPPWDEASNEVFKGIIISSIKKTGDQGSREYGAAALRTAAESPEWSGTKCSEARTCSGWPGPQATPKHLP